MKQRSTAHAVRCGMAIGAVLLAFSATAQASTQVWPASATVPANLLRIEVQFDTPLRAPLDPRHVQLVDERGAIIPDALLGLPLPSRDGRRVTILLDPGRIKSGVLANRELGLALHAGQRVTLRVDDPQLTEPVHRQWQVSPALRRAIDPASWPLQLPTAGTRETLSLQLDRPLQADATQMIVVTDASDRPLGGTVRMSADASGWQFIPAKPWQPGRHRLVVYHGLEDAAGNRMCAAFEYAALDKIDCGQDWWRTFELKGSASGIDSAHR